MPTSDPQSPADPLDRLRAAILADRALQDRLAAITDRETFIAEARAAAERLGMGITRDAIMAAIRPDPLGIARWDGTPAQHAPWPNPGWRPGGIGAAGGELVLDWTHFGGAPLAAPFFEDDLRRARARPFNSLIRYRTPLAALAERAPERLTVPDGLIFHMSRCGSTLVARLLAALDDTIVVSEAPPLDQVAQLAHTRPDVPLNVRVGLLRAMAGALAGSPASEGRRYFVKLDSWHTLALPLFRAAFPDTPWLFLHRDPVEVLVSHMRMRGVQTVPGAMPPGFYGFAEDPAMPIEEHCARVLARVCGAVLDQEAPGGGLIVDYADLPDAIESRILPHFGVVPDPAERTRFAEVGSRSAKAPAQSFAPDGAGKREEASAAIREAAARFLAAPHRALGKLGTR